MAVLLALLLAAAPGAQAGLALRPAAPGASPALRPLVPLVLPGGRPSPQGLRLVFDGGRPRRPQAALSVPALAPLHAAPAPPRRPLVLPSPSLGRYRPRPRAGMGLLFAGTAVFFSGALLDVHTGAAFLAGIGLTWTGMFLESRQQGRDRDRPLEAANARVLRAELDRLGAAGPLRELLERLLARDRRERLEAWGEAAGRAPQTAGLVRWLALAARAETVPENLQAAVLALGRVGGDAAEEELEALRREAPENGPWLEKALEGLRARKPAPAPWVPASEEGEAESALAEAARRLASTEPGLPETARARALGEAVRELEAAPDPDRRSLALRRLQDLLSPDRPR